jgi:hypothetical protein
MPVDKKLLLSSGLFWITRNKITFEGFVLKSLVIVIFTIYSFLKYWQVCTPRRML